MISSAVFSTRSPLNARTAAITFCAPRWRNARSRARPRPAFAPSGERMTPSPGCVEEGELLFRNLQEEARRLAQAVAVEPPVERVGQVELPLRPGEPHVAEPALLLQLLRVVHGLH